MKTFIVDSFTDRPFAGNPAGVCLPEKPLDDEKMLLIAQELGLSETAFLTKENEDIDVYRIRFFSPVMEIPLCGHATLASCKIMMKLNNTDNVHFVNINDLALKATQADGKITMEFPIYEVHPAEAPSALLDALGIDSVNNVVYNAETKILLLEISSTELLANLKPDFAALYKSHDSINGVLITAPSTSNDGYDFHSRYFWPWSGTNEDPVTGGTHTFLTKYWAERLGKSKLQSFQSSKRSGFMQVELVDGKLLITAQAHIVLEGVLHI